MLVIEPSSGRDSDKELRAVRLGSRVRHRNGIRSIVLERRVKFILERSAPE